jgi:hypothetical protein
MLMLITGRRVRRAGLVGTMLVAALGLTGCTNPYSPGQRALGGGAIGAGAGAVIGAATGGSPAGGALIGGAIGALGGALTTPQTPRGDYNRGGYGNQNYGGPGPGYNNDRPPPPPPRYYDSRQPTPPGY